MRVKVAFFLHRIAIVKVELLFLVRDIKRA